MSMPNGFFLTFRCGEGWSSHCLPTGCRRPSKDASPCIRPSHLQVQECNVVFKRGPRQATCKLTPGCSWLAPATTRQPSRLPVLCLAWCIPQIRWKLWKQCFSLREDVYSVFCSPPTAIRTPPGSAVISGRAPGDVGLSFEDLAYRQSTKRILKKKGKGNWKKKRSGIRKITQ